MKPVARQSAEARAPRRHIARRVSRWLLALLLLALLLLIVFASWLLRSESGRDLALQRAAAALPPGAFTWASASGTLSSRLTLEDVRYSDSGLVVELERVTLELAPMHLLRQQLRVIALELDSGRIQLPPAQQDPTASPWPRELTLPGQLPQWELPFEVLLQQLDITNVVIEQDQLSLIELRSLRASGQFSRGRVELESLQLDSDLGTLSTHARLDTTRGWDTTLKADLKLAIADADPLPVMIALQGNVDDLNATVSAGLPAPAILEIHAGGGLGEPRWRFTLEAPRVDPARFGVEGAAFGVSLQGNGTLREARLSGSAERDGRRLRLEPSSFRLIDGELHLAPLALALDQASASANGVISLREIDPVLQLALTWSDWPLPGTEDAVVVSSSGKARIDGLLDDYRLELDAQMRRADEIATVQLRGTGSRTGIEADTLNAITPGGRLGAMGTLHWSPFLDWQVEATLDDFDPGYFAPEYPGAIDAKIESQGQLRDEALQAVVHIEQLGGRWRQLSLSGGADINFNADGSGRGVVELGLGSSRLDANATWGSSIEAQLTLAPLQLNDVMPDARGRIEGRIDITGQRDTPTIAADLTGRTLEFAGVSVRTIALDARIEKADTGRFELQADEVAYGNTRLDSVTVSGDGDRADHRLTLAAHGEPGDLELALHGGVEADRWLGEIRTLQLTPRDRDAWQLRTPAQMAADTASGEWSLAQSCLHLESATMCADAEWRAGTGAARVELNSLPLDAFDPLLSSALATPASAYGTVSAELRLARDSGGALSGTLQLDSAEGGLRLDPQSPRELLVYRALTLTGRLDPGELDLRAEATLGQDGNLVATLSTDEPFAPDGALRGRLDATLADLGFIELLSDRIAETTGALRAQFDLGGSRLAPKLQGDAALSEFAVELPALGVHLTDGKLGLSSQTESIRILGEVTSGDGSLQLDGRLMLAADAPERFTMTLKGSDFTAAALPEFSASVSPDVELRLAARELRVRGEVAVPRALIDLEQLQGATRASPDVVIVDAEQEPQDALAIDSDVSVVLGENVRLNGFGLSGELSGRVNVRDRPGRATVARGRIDVAGGYKAYGQDLKITRGRLTFASTALDNPALDVRAERKVESVTVGVQVRGTALTPELTLWSQPSLDQAEQLSYLVLGRPLNSASQADGAQLSQAAAALGGNLLAKKIGSRMGLDEVGVANSRALGGAALTVGKYLSPKLYVSYGVSLFGSGQVVTFKYILSQVWSIQIDSSQENRATLNYRLER